MAHVTRCVGVSAGDLTGGLEGFLSNYADNIRIWATSGDQDNLISRHSSFLQTKSPDMHYVFKTRWIHNGPLQKPHKLGKLTKIYDCRQENKLRAYFPSYKLKIQTKLIS